MKFNLVFGQDKVKPARAKALENIASVVELKGFRKGKAPLDIVEKNIDPEKLVEETINLLIPKEYGEYIDSNKLKPITAPKIKLTKMVNEGDWEFEVEIVEKPVVKLNNYIDAIKGQKAKDLIWTPGKEVVKPKDTPEDKQAEANKKINQILTTLIKTCEVEIADMLLEEEANRSLASLLDQVNKLGLTIDQYLNSMGKKPEELRKEYRESALNSLKLEFILEAISRDANISLSEDEINEYFKGAEDKVLAELKKDTTQLAAIKYMLIKRKTINYLVNL